MLRNVPVRFKWGSQTLPRTWGDGRGVLRRVPGGSQRRHRAYALFPILLPEFTRASPIGCARSACGDHLHALRASVLDGDWVAGQTGGADRARVLHLYPLSRLEPSSRELRADSCARFT